MKSFRFRLQRVLDVKHAQEERRLAEFGREQQQLATERAKLAVFCEERERQVDTLRGERLQPMAAGWQNLSTRYLDRVARVVDFQNHRVEAQTTAVEQARGGYLAAHRESQALEHVRDQHHAEWTQESLREEGRVLDEVGSQMKRGGE